MCVDCHCGQPVVTATEPPRHLQLGQRLLVHNDAQAAANREQFAAAGVRVINLLSSPGSGKTALLERLALELAPSSLAMRHPMAVIVGDLGKYGVAEPDHALWETHPVVNQLLPHLIHAKLRHRRVAASFLGDQRVGIVNGGLAALGRDIHALNPSDLCA